MLGRTDHLPGAGSALERACFSDPRGQAQALSACCPPATKGALRAAGATLSKFAQTVSRSGYDDRVTRLKLYILGRALTLDDLLVVEGDSSLAAVRVLAQNINGFLFGEITESPGDSDRIEHRRRVGDHVRPRPVHQA